MQPQAASYAILITPALVVVGAMQFSQGKPLTGAALIGLGVVLSGFWFLQN